MNRYIIYEMIDSFFKVNLPGRFGGNKVKGIITDVFRDNINGIIVITFDDKQKIEIREPDSIEQNDNKFIFTYGNKDEISDDDFFHETKKNSHKGYGVDETFDRLSSDFIEIIFENFDIPISYKKKKHRKNKYGNPKKNK